VTSWELDQQQHHNFDKMPFLMPSMMHRCCHRKWTKVAQARHKSISSSSTC